MLIKIKLCINVYNKKVDNKEICHKDGHKIFFFWKIVSNFVKWLLLIIIKSFDLRKVLGLKSRR